MATSHYTICCSTGHRVNTMQHPILKHLACLRFFMSLWPVHLSFQLCETFTD